VNVFGKIYLVSESIREFERNAVAGEFARTCNLPTARGRRDG
jgi:hypothetical protein